MSKLSECEASVIILSWNRKKEILKTIADLKLQTYREFEIIVIDQGSNDNSVSAIKAVYPDIQIICLHKNMGVPFGRNVGALNAKGEILVFLDNDASLAEDAIDRAVNTLSKNSNIGIVGFKILNEHTKTIDLCSWVYQKSKIKAFDTEFYTYTFCGCGHAIKKEVFKKIGYYWDELFFGWEEIELSIKILNAGFDILYDPSIIVYHRLSSGNRIINKLHECLRLRNSLWVIWRYYPIYRIPFEALKYIFAYLIKATRNRYFFQYIIFLLKGFAKIWLIFTKKDRVSCSAFKKFKQLSYKGSFFYIIKTLMAHE